MDEYDYLETLVTTITRERKKAATLVLAVFALAAVSAGMLALLNKVMSDEAAELRAAEEARAREAAKARHPASRNRADGSRNRPAPVPAAEPG